jgi:peptidoglycan hydrolase-like protein with peptidoglycan-binding domain
VLAEVAQFVEACRQTVLRVGDHGPVVEFLQTQLDRNGHRLCRTGKPGAGVDGHFGRMTDKAVRQFQRDEALTIDGIVGPATWQALTD